MLLNYQIGSYSPSPSSASLNPSVHLDQIEIESQSGLKTDEYVPITPENLDRVKGLDKGAGGAGKLDESLKSFNSLTSDEKRIVEQLLKEGKDVKLIPETPNIGKTYDLTVNNVATELKTLNSNNINTLVTKVGRALKQLDGSGQIIYDVSKAGFTAEQMVETKARLVGKYGKEILSKIIFVK